MLVHCEICLKNYNDADRWTLCPHPQLDDWDARNQLDDWMLETKLKLGKTLSKHQI